MNAIRTTLTLTNDIHQTSVIVHPLNSHLSASQMRRVRRELCGMADCSCNTVCGAVHGHQTSRTQIISDGSGGAEVFTSVR
jgi:hypothetical protein